MAAVANYVVGGVPVVVATLAQTPLLLPITNSLSFSHEVKTQRHRLYLNCSKTNNRARPFSPSSPPSNKGSTSCFVLACLPPRASDSSSSSSSSNPRPSSAASSTKLYVSGLSFRTTEESLRNAFENFGQLVEVNLVMDKIANRPRGFAFLRYATKEGSQKAIEGMHGKFLDGRVIFVEVARPRSELRQGLRQNTE